jgi:hypothetical protein
MAKKKSTSASSASSRAAAQRRVGSAGHGVTRVATRRQDALRLRHQKPGVDRQLLEDQQLRIFKVQVRSNRRMSLALFYDQARELLIQIKTPSHLLRLLNGRHEAFFGGCVVNKHLRLDWMLTDEEAGRITW